MKSGGRTTKCGHSVRARHSGIAERTPYGRASYDAVSTTARRLLPGRVAVWEGGNAVTRDKGLSLRYAGVAVQYFASVIAVDDEQPRKDFLYRARPTLETALVKGRLKRVGADSIVLTVGEHGDQTFYVPPKGEARIKLEAAGLGEGTPVAVGTVVGFPLGYVHPRTRQAESCQPARLDADTLVNEAVELGEFEGGRGLLFFFGLGSARG